MHKKKQDLEYQQRVEAIREENAQKLEKITREAELKSQKQQEELLIEKNNLENERRRLLEENEAAEEKARELERELEETRRNASIIGSNEICNVHHVEYSVCNCTNYRPKELLIQEVDKLRRLQRNYDEEATLLDTRNKELELQLEQKNIEIQLTEKKALEDVQRQVEEAIQNERNRLQEQLNEALRSKEEIELRAIEASERVIQLEEEIEQKNDSGGGFFLISGTSTTVPIDNTITLEERMNIAKNEEEILRLQFAELNGLTNELQKEVRELEETSTNDILSPPPLPPRPIGYQLSTLNSNELDDDVNDSDEENPPPLPPRPNERVEKIQSFSISKTNNKKVKKTSEYPIANSIYNSASYVVQNVYKMSKDAYESNKKKRELKAKIKRGEYKSETWDERLAAATRENERLSKINNNNEASL